MRIIITILIVVASIIIGYEMILSSKEQKAPGVINPIDVEPEMVDSLLQGKGYGHRIGEFSFQNQDNQTITLNEVKGKVFVAEYFFTTCGTICPKMNQQMKRVQEAFKTASDFKILSFTVDPEIDTVAQMKRYADLHGALAGKWHFLTGNKEELYQLARKSFFVLKPAEAVNEGDAHSDFIHTNNFVLVDRHLRIRGYCDGTSAKEVDQLIKNVALLLAEKD